MGKLGRNGLKIGLVLLLGEFGCLGIVGRYGGNYLVEFVVGLFFFILSLWRKKLWLLILVINL